jgi:ribosomal protein L29
MNSAELRAFDGPELEIRLRACIKELLRLNLRRKMGSVEKTHCFCSLRREIARIKTLLSEMEVNGDY